MGEFEGELRIYTIEEYLEKHNTAQRTASSPCGTITFNDSNTDPTENIGNTNTGSSTYDCVISIITHEVCPFGGTNHDHSVCGPNGTGPGAPYYTVEWDCTLSNSQKTNTKQKSSDPCIGGSTSNNITTPVGINQPTIVPCEQNGCETEFINNVLNNVPNLTFEQIEWVSDLTNIGTVVNISDFIDVNTNSTETQNWAKGQVELEVLTKNITWQPSTGTVAGFRYTHTYFDGSRGYFKLEDGSIVVNSSSEQTLTKSGDLRDKYNEFNPNSRYYYIKVPGQQWAEMLFNPHNLADGLANLFKLGTIDLGKNLGRYVLPIEDIMVLINGKDFDGQDFSRWQAAGFLLLTVVPGSKALKPVARIATNATRWTKVISKGGKSYRYTSKIVNGIVEFGTYNSTKFREVLGIANNTLKQAHHVLSRNLRTHRAIQKAAQNKTNPFHIDEFLNGIPVDKWRNQTNHFQYDTRVRNILDKIPSSLNEEDTYNRLIGIIGGIKDVIKNNPNTHLNDLIF